MSSILKPPVDTVEATRRDVETRFKLEKSVPKETHEILKRRCMNYTSLDMKIEVHSKYHAQWLKYNEMLNKIHTCSEEIEYLIDVHNEQVLSEDFTPATYLNKPKIELSRELCRQLQADINEEVSRLSDWKKEMLLQINADALKQQNKVAKSASSAAAASGINVTKSPSHHAQPPALESFLSKSEASQSQAQKQQKRPEKLRSAFDKDTANQQQWQQGPTQVQSQYLPPNTQESKGRMGYPKPREPTRSSLPRRPERPDTPGSISSTSRTAGSNNDRPVPNHTYHPQQLAKGEVVAIKMNRNSEDLHSDGHTRHSEIESFKTSH